MSETIFYKIAKGEIPTNVVYEDDVVMAFLDTSQVTKGHTLLIPKEPIKDIFDYDAEYAGQVLSRLPKVANALKQAFPDMTGLNILNNNGKSAYQSVFHSHFHLIPRYDKDNDGFGLKWETHEDDYSDNDMQELADHIRQYTKEV